MADYTFNPDKWLAAGGTIDNGIAWTASGLGKDANGKSYFRGPTGEAIPMQTQRTGKYSGVIVDPKQARSLGYDPTAANKELQSVFGAFDKTPDLGNKLGGWGLQAGITLATAGLGNAAMAGLGASGALGAAGSGAISGAIGGGAGAFASGTDIGKGVLGGAVTGGLAGAGGYFGGQLGGALSPALVKPGTQLGSFLGNNLSGLIFPPKAPVPVGPSQNPYTSFQGLGPTQMGMGPPGIPTGFYGGGNPFAGPVMGPGNSALALRSDNPFESMRQRLRTGTGDYTSPNYTPGMLASQNPMGGSQEATMPFDPSQYKQLAPTNDYDRGSTDATIGFNPNDNPWGAI